MSDSTAACAAGQSHGCSGCSLSSMNEMVAKHYRRAIDWESTTFSAAVVAGVNAIFVVLWVLSFSPLSIVCYAAALIIASGFIIKMVKGDILGAPGTPIEVASKEAVEKFINTSYEKINLAATRAREIFLWVDRKHSAAAVGILFVAGWLSTRVSAFVAVFIAANYVLLKKPTAVAYRKYAAPHVAPYVNQASGYVHKVVGSIPSVDKLGKNKKM